MDVEHHTIVEGMRLECGSGMCAMASREVQVRLYLANGSSYIE